ncbi:MAG: type II secretion system protein [bacterium JZ-2024 1]
MNTRRGFTMIEVIAVVAIVTLLAAIVLPAVFSQLRRGRVARLISEAESIRSASLTYFTERGKWPRASEVDGAIKELLRQPRLGHFLYKGPYLDKAPRQRPSDNRFANRYTGLLMLNDLDDGSGDDATTDRNANQTSPDRFVYEGAVPPLDAAEIDDSLDGSLDPMTGSVVLYLGDDWTTVAEGSCEMLIIVHEGF